MEKNNAQFIKVGDRLMPKQKGMDYDLIKGQIYNLSWDDYMGEIIFKENGELNLPKKVYESKADKLFKSRVFKQFNREDSKDVNILLNGTKGTGKTMMAKIIAKESNLPIIIVTPGFPERELIKFFKRFNAPVCIIFDEIEKNFRTDKMLDFLDGVEKTTKKLVIITCNRMDNFSEYLKDRCSRIRYLRNYTIQDNYEFIPMIAKDLGIKNVDKTVDFIKEFIKIPSFDNVNAFLNEVKMFEEDDVETPLENIIKYINIELKKDPSHTEKNESKETQEHKEDDRDCTVKMDAYSERLKAAAKQPESDSTIEPIPEIDLDWEDEEDYGDCAENYTDYDEALYGEAAA